MFYPPRVEISTNLCTYLLPEHILRGFTTSQPVWDPKFLSQINKKLKIFK